MYVTVLAKMHRMKQERVSPLVVCSLQRAQGSERRRDLTRLYVAIWFSWSEVEFDVAAYCDPGELLGTS